jgi:hypothetical protein
VREVICPFAKPGPKPARGSDATVDHQAPTVAREAVALMLDVPESEVEVEVVPVGCS